MSKQYHQIRQWLGLNNLLNPRDIGSYLSKAQNVSIDKHGMIRTIGGLEDFTKVDGATALTQTAKLCPGASLFTYGSEHWRGTDTVVDVMANNNAVSDHQTEADATAGWTDAGDLSTTSVADTDGAAIASNGTDYIFKHNTLTGGTFCYQSTTTVAGQPYIFSVDLYCRTATFIKVQIVDNASSKTLGYTVLHTAASWSNYQLEFVALSTSTQIRIIIGDNNKIAYSDDIYLTKAPRRDLDTNWLALLDAATAQLDLYNVNGDAFSAGLLDFGTVSSYVATVDTINFPTVKTITDSTSQFLNQGIQAGDVRVISGCTTQTANNIMFVVEHVTTSTITARGNPFTVAADEDGTVTLTKYNPVAFHYVNEALRASPVGGGIALRPKHYSFVDRIHFEGAGSSERKWANWYANDVGPVAPTDVAFDAAVDSGLSGNLTAGAGWEVGMTVTADDGEWPAGTYILACSFIYDDGQESALYVPSTDVAMTAITEGASLTLCAKADTATDYDERISGGRVYTRIDETDDPWILLLDISMAKGARATLSGTYNAWAEGATTNDVYTASFISKRQNIDSYESLAGIDPTTRVEVFTDNNAFWNTSVIARNRCFIGAPRYTAKGGSLSHFRDRILYSTVGAYDTFPIDNYIDVVQGDAEDYVKLGVYGNDLLCYKRSTLYIIDISDPDPAGWQMKQDANKGKYPFRGIAHPGAYFETPHGPAWCNEFGVFLYTGNEIVELLKDKIELSEHPLAYQRYMEFDGTDDYVTHANDADLNFGASTDFSLEIIFKFDVTGTSEYLIGKGQTGAGGKRYLLYKNSNDNLSFNVDDDTTNVNFAGTTTLAINTWYHAAVTADRDGNAQLYLNGATEGTATSIAAVGDIDDATKPFAVGIYSGDLAGSLVDGIIALVRVYNSLIGSEVAALYAGAPPTATPVLEWKPKSIGDATWVDTSANSLDGTVVGATAIYEDSWAKFYTDYSILGYHARTNQIIIMRDCTGKWSSGQDYGDCWIVDLDTGAVTTGRRISTKGIAYSNFATDWNQELIIAEQTSSTSVTIKQWTDEPQSQAVGLIDVRFADFDAGNPAIKKIIDAFIATYKSSAAQTNPLSYALDNDDRQTAWTRITGDFDAEGFFEKYVAEPTSFFADSIRLKLDNPTAAGTIEVNDMQIRHEPQELKLT